MRERGDFLLLPIGFLTDHKLCCWFGRQILAGHSNLNNESQLVKGQLLPLIFASLICSLEKIVLSE